MQVLLSVFSAGTGFRLFNFISLNIIAQQLKGVGWDVGVIWPALQFSTQSLTGGLMWRGESIQKLRNSSINKILSAK